MASIARWLSSSKTRTGRRPISVHKLLEKERKGTLFKKHGFKLQGEMPFGKLDIAIENMPGSVRKGKNEDGTPWETRFKSPYGYIRGTKGADGEPIDCYVGKDRDADTAYVVHQRNADGSHDEDTVMLGYGSKSDARRDIRRHYDDPKYLGSITAIAIEKLEKLLEEKKTHEKLGVATHEVEYLDGDAPGVTGLAAKLPRRKGEVPSREDTDPYPNPKVETRQENMNTANAGGFTGFDDLGKTSSSKIGKAMEALGELSKSWEVPSDDSPSPYGGHMRQGTGGLSEAVSPERSAQDQEMQGPFRLSLSQIAPTEDDAREDSKYSEANYLPNPGTAAPPPRFPKATRMKDNSLDVQDAGAYISDIGQGNAPSDGIDKAAMTTHTQFVHQANCLQRFEEGFHEELSKIAAANYGIPPWVGERHAFQQFVDQTLYKEAVSLAGIGQGVRSAAGQVGQAVGRLRPQVDPEVAAFRQNTGFFSTGMGRDLHSGGQMLAHNPQAAGQAAGLGARDVGALGAMKPSSPFSRIAGETAAGAGHHIQHQGAGMMALNPLGAGTGGAIEGFTRGVGKELQNVGHQGVQSAGRALVQHAPKVGLGGEFLAGGLLHAPGLAPQIGHHLAPLAHEGIQHLLAAGTEQAYQHAPKFVPRMARAFTGRLAAAA